MKRSSSPRRWSSRSLCRERPRPAYLRTRRPRPWSPGQGASSSFSSSWFMRTSSPRTSSFDSDGHVHRQRLVRLARDPARPGHVPRRRTGRPRKSRRLTAARTASRRSGDVLHGRGARRWIGCQESESAWLSIVARRPRGQSRRESSPPSAGGPAPDAATIEAAIAAARPTRVADIAAAEGFAGAVCSSS